MEAKDLRIGNWVNKKLYTGKCAPPELIETKIRSGGFIDFAEDLEPIPLSPEILERCGFENGIKRSGLTEIQIKEFSTAMQGVFKGEYAVTLIGHVPYQLKKRILYLHQLQNIYFALTGQELEIKEIVTLSNG